MTPTRRTLIGALAAFGLATSTVAQEVTLRLHQFLPAQVNMPAYILDVWADQLEVDSDGRIRIDRFPSMQLGATAVGIPVPAVPEALSRGVIDGAVIPWEVVPALKVQELVTNHTEFPGAALYTTAFIFVMNPDAYDPLPEDLQAVIDANSGLEFLAFAGRTMQEYDAPGRALAAGNNIITLTKDQVAAWQAASQSTIDNWIAEADAAGIDGTGLYAQATALIAKHSADA